MSAIWFSSWQSSDRRTDAGQKTVPENPNGFSGTSSSQSITSCSNRHPGSRRYSDNNRLSPSCWPSGRRLRGNRSSRRALRFSPWPRCSRRPRGSKPRRGNNRRRRNKRRPDSIHRPGNRSPPSSRRKMPRPPRRQPEEAPSKRTSVSNA